MLQFIRSKAGSFVVKLLFVVLIGSFGFFGIGDFLRQRTNTDTTVITVGSTKIPAATVQHDVQAQLSRLRETSRTQLTIEQAKALGLVDQMVDGIVTRTLIDNAAEAEHLAIAPAQILAAVQQEPGFHDKDGSFNRDLLRNALAANGLSERQFEVTIHEDLARNLVTSPVRLGVQPPDQLVTLLYQIRNERRVADWVFLPTNSVKDPPAPDTPALQDFYAKHHELYTAPEYRGIAVLTLTLADVMDTIHPSDQELRDAYQQRQDEFTVAEQRHVLQMLLQDKATADQAEAQLQQGQDFFDVAKRLAKQDKTAVDLDWVKKSELPGELGDFAFGAAENVVSQPIKGDFGWSIVKVTETKPAHGKNFEEAKPELEAALKNDQGADALYKLSNKIEDAIAGGTDFDGLAQRFNLKPQQIAAIDATGSVPGGTTLANPPAPLDMLTKTAFSTAEGQMSGMQDSGNGNAFFVLKVEHITPSVLKPFDGVKAEVQNAWMTNRRTELLADMVKKFMADITKNVNFADVAKTQALTIGTSKPFLRSAKQPESGLPEELTTKLFHFDQGQTASAMTQDGAYIAQLKSVIVADPGAAPTAADTLRQELAQDLAAEYVTEFAASLKRRFPVEIKTAAIDQLFPTGTQ